MSGGVLFKSIEDIVGILGGIWENNAIELMAYSTNQVIFFRLYLLVGRTGQIFAWTRLRQQGQWDIPENNQGFISQVWSLFSIGINKLCWILF